MDEKDADALFRLPLSEFTAARNRLADQLKKAGKTDEAARVKTLPKPPVSAWVVNQLYWRDDALFSRLMTTTHQLRVVQTEKLAGSAGDLRTPIETRNAAITELTKAAAAILQGAGMPAAATTIRRVLTTLEALATYGRQPGGPVAGRLTNDVDPPGLSALAALMPSGADSTRAATRVIQFAQPDRSTVTSRNKAARDPEHERRERRRRITEAGKAIRAAERSLAQASRVAAQARAAMKQAAARAAAADNAKAALTEQLEKAASEADALRQQARHAAAHAEETAQALDDAEQALARARDAAKDAQSSS
jgi:hypothetical protein